MTKTAVATDDEIHDIDMFLTGFIDGRMGYRDKLHAPGGSMIETGVKDYALGYKEGYDARIEDENSRGNKRPRR